MRVFALATLIIIACKSRTKEAVPTPPRSDAAAVVIDAVPLPAPKLPGALYFKRDDALVKLEGGGFVTEFPDVGAPVYPSQLALPDGRVVGIASLGDGEPGSEQLVLIGPGTKIERIGPASTQVRDPAVDPAGKWIVIESKLEPHSELYRIDLATQQSTQLTNNPQGNFTPAVLDAKTIVFASSRDGDSEIYKLDLATKKATRITAFHRDDFAPRPRGKTIAFLSDREGPPRIFLVEADGTNLRRLSSNTDATADEDAPAWSPDGKSIAFLRAGRLVVHDIAARTERTFTPSGARDVELAWSPDGQWIAVSRTQNSVSDLWAIPIAGGEAIGVTKDANARLPRWHSAPGQVGADR